MTVHKMSMMMIATILGAVKAVYVDSNSPDVLHQGYSSILVLRRQKLLRSKSSSVRPGV